MWPHLEDKNESQVSLLPLIMNRTTFFFFAASFFKTFWGHIKCYNRGVVPLI